MIDDLKKINIRSIELRRISLPLVTPFRTSFSTETHRDILLVRVKPTMLSVGANVSLETNPLFQRIC